MQGVFRLSRYIHLPFRAGQNIIRSDYLSTILLRRKRRDTRPHHEHNNLIRLSQRVGCLIRGPYFTRMSSTS
jgi:hypothetical protein